MQEKDALGEKLLLYSIHYDPEIQNQFNATSSLHGDNSVDKDPSRHGLQLGCDVKFQMKDHDGSHDHRSLFLVATSGSNPKC